MENKNKIKDILLAISLIGIVGVSVGLAIVATSNKKEMKEIKEESTKVIDEFKTEINDSNKQNFDSLKNEGNKKIIKQIENYFLEDLFKDSTILKNIETISKLGKKEFEKETKSVFETLKESIKQALDKKVLKVLGTDEKTGIGILENSDEFGSFNEKFESTIDWKDLKTSIGHKEFGEAGKDDFEASTGIFEELTSKKESIYNKIILFFKDLSNEDKIYFLSNGKDKENEFASKSVIVGRFKALFHNIINFNSKFVNMSSVELIEKIDNAKTAEEKKAIIKTNKEKKQYTVKGILLDGSEKFESKEEFKTREINYKFVKSLATSFSQYELEILNLFVSKKLEGTFVNVFELVEKKDGAKDGSNFGFVNEAKNIKALKETILALLKTQNKKGEIEKKIKEILKTELEQIKFSEILEEANFDNENIEKLIIGEAGKNNGDVNLKTLIEHIKQIKKI